VVDFANAEVDEPHKFEEREDRRNGTYGIDEIAPPDDGGLPEPLRIVRAEDRDDEEEEETTSEEDEEESSEPQPAPEPVRVALTPTDQDGNPLALNVDLRCVGVHPKAEKELESNSDDSKQPRDGREMIVEKLKITKAVTVTTEGKTVVQIHKLPGPESSATSSSIGIRWYHMHAEQLDWMQFKVGFHSKVSQVTH
jgi:hypothetical protein